jgi:hypothetical protein
MTDTRSRPQADVAATRPARRQIQLWLPIAAGLAVALYFLLAYPNVRHNAQNLALTTLTPILVGIALGLWLSGSGRGVARLALTGAAAILVVVSTLVYAGPLVFGHTQAHDMAPVFVAATVTPAPASTAAPASVAARQGAFNHQAGTDTVSGTAVLGQTSNGQWVLRLQGLNATPGPDLYVYLSNVAAPTSRAEVMSGLEVSKLKATNGDTNYPLPVGTEVSQLKSAVIYCKSFSVIFGYATLS